MAEDKHYVDFDNAKYLWDKAAERYVRKDGDKGLSDENYTAEEKDKLAELENYELPAASTGELGGIKIGAGLEIDADGVVKTVVNPSIEMDWDQIVDTPTTLAGFGITDAATKQELEEVREEVSKLYKYKGKVPTYADLLNIQNPENGDVYDVEDTGTNYAWNADEARWDNLGELFHIDNLTEYDLDIITGEATSEAALRDLLVAGGNIELGDNLPLTMAVAITKDTVLDMNGHKLTSTIPNYALEADGAKLTLKNANMSSSGRLVQAINGGEVIIDSGSFNSGNVAFAAVGEGSKVTMYGGAITAQEGGIGAFDGAEVEINAGNITGIDNFPVFTNGTAGRGGNTIVFNDGQLVGNIQSAGYEACGVYIANNDVFTMNGGIIAANGGCGILMRGGTVVINDGLVRATPGDHVPGWVGDNKTKMSASAVIYHESANYPGKAGMSLTINGGTFNGVDHSVEVLSNEATPSVTINGGSFNPAV